MMDASMPQETTPAEIDSKKSERPRAAGMFWIAFWLAVALMGAKIYHIRGPDNWGGREINR